MGIERTLPVVVVVIPLGMISFVSVVVLTSVTVVVLIGVVVLPRGTVVILTGMAMDHALADLDEVKDLESGPGTSR